MKKISGRKCYWKEIFQQNRLYENKWNLEVNSFFGLHSANRDYTMTKYNDDCIPEAWQNSFSSEETNQFSHELKKLSMVEDSVMTGQVLSGSGPTDAK